MQLRILTLAIALFATTAHPMQSQHHDLMPNCLEGLLYGAGMAYIFNGLEHIDEIEKLSTTISPDRTERIDTLQEKAVTKILVGCTLSISGFIVHSVRYNANRENK